MSLILMIVFFSTFLTSWWLAKHITQSSGFAWAFLLSFFPGLFLGMSVNVSAHAFIEYGMAHNLSAEIPQNFMLYMVLLTGLGILAGIVQSMILFRNNKEGEDLEEAVLAKSLSVRKFALLLNVYIGVVVTYFLVFAEKLSN